MITLFVNTEVDMGGQKSCGLIGLSNSLAWNNFIDVAAKNKLLPDA